MSGADIFISYSREDRAAARHFADCLTGAGFNVWWDAALHSGETFDEVIERELKAARAVVVLWSPRSVRSRWVRAEATLADRHNKLVPVIIEVCDRPIIFELHHTVDLGDWTGDTSDLRWQDLQRDLRRLVARGKDEPAPKEPPAAWRREPAVAPSAQAPGRRRRDALPSDDDATQYVTSANRHGFDSDEFHCLEIVDGEPPQKRFIVNPVGLKIGRSPPADVILADTRVSRAHCVVEFAGRDLRVSDLKSTNGTFIDGERVDGTAMLAVGSVLRVGNVQLRHELRSRADV